MDVDPPSPISIALSPDDITRLLESEVEFNRVMQPFMSLTGRGRLAATAEERNKLIRSLPALTETDLVKFDQEDSHCPICLTSFIALINAEEMAIAMDSPAVAAQDLGVTRLANTCGHMFCRKDISTWIMEHDSCPSCRTPYITPPPTLPTTGTTAEDASGSESDTDTNDLALLFQGFANRDSRSNSNSTDTTSTPNNTTNGTNTNNTNGNTDPNAATPRTPGPIILDERQFNRLARMMAHLPNGLFTDTPPPGQRFGEGDYGEPMGGSTASSSEDRTSRSSGGRSRSDYVGMYS